MHVELALDQERAVLQRQSSPLLEGAEPQQVTLDSFGEGAEGWPLASQAREAVDVLVEALEARVDRVNRADW